MTMKPYDPQQAARVWQRVQNQKQEMPSQPDPADDLPAMIMEEWLCATTFLQLSKQVSQRERAVLQRMSRECQSQAAALKGIYNLTVGYRPVVKLPALQKDPVELVLRKCYSRQLRSLALYEARASDPEYGPVFARMALQKREHCKSLLEVIGGLQQKEPKNRK
jgi:hypothetical protein